MSAKMSVREKLKRCIMFGAFLKTKDLYPRLSLKKLEQLLHEIAGPHDKVEDAVAYSYLCFLILERPSKELHWMAVRLLSGPLRWMNGALATSFYHAEQAYALDQDDVNSQEELIAFYFDNPLSISFNNKPQAEDEVPIERLVMLARKVLEKKPRNLLAREVIKHYDNPKYVRS